MSKKLMRKKILIIKHQKFDDCENINSVNPLYLIIYEVIGYTEEKNGSRYLVLDSIDENKEV